MEAKKAKRGADWPWKITDESRAVNASDIVRDEGLQTRQKMIPDLVKKYADEMQAGHEFPPIMLGRVGGKMLLLDGWHRLEAASITNGREAVEAIIREMTPTQATWAACEANLTHGQGYSSREKRNVLKMFIKSKQHMQGGRIAMSYRDISAKLGIKLGTLYRWMELDHPRTFKAMAKDAPEMKLSEPPTIDHDPENVRRAQQALRDALNYCNGLRCPEKRFELIEEAQRTVEQMRQKEYREADW